MSPYRYICGLRLCEFWADDICRVEAGHFGIWQDDIARHQPRVGHLAKHRFVVVRQLAEVDDERRHPPPETAVDQRCSDAFDEGHLFTEGQRSKTDREIIRFVGNRRSFDEVLVHGLNITPKTSERNTKVRVST